MQNLEAHLGQRLVFELLVWTKGSQRVTGQKLVDAVGAVGGVMDVAGSPRDSAPRSAHLFRTLSEGDWK